jgi:phosphatidylserine decarboxylase
MFHKEGHLIISISLVIAMASVLGIDYLALEPIWLSMSLKVMVLILLIMILQFFRNPKRRAALNHNHILSPVDGKVVVIEEVMETEVLGDQRKQVSIFMSPINVHVTRYPASGVVSYSKYHPGKYLVAWHPKSSTENERTTVVVKTPKFGPVLYRQIAGALARRIVNYAQVGQKAIQGEDAGFIKFGSRVDVFLPLDAVVTVKLGQKVKGAETVIAIYPDKDPLDD